MPRKTLPASAVKGATRPAKTDAPVTTGAMRGDAPVQRTVPAKGAPSPFAGAASVFAAAGTASAAPKRDGRHVGHVLPPLDIKQLKVISGVPMPPRRAGQKGRTRYDGVFDMLQADGQAVLGIEVKYEKALRSALKAYLKARPQLAASSVYAVRITSSTTCGVWRAARTGGQA